MPQRVRLKDIAERLDLDKSTVSLALRNHPRISKATQKQVQETARQMGYKPDPALRRLAAMRWQGHAPRRGGSICLLCAHRQDYPVHRGRFQPLVQGEAESLGYGFETLFLEDYSGPGVAARILKARGVEGLIVLPSHDRYAYRKFPWESFSAVQLLSGEEGALGLPIIRQDAFGATLEAGRRIREAAPRSAAIVLLSQDQPSVTDLRFRAAALLVLEQWTSADIRVFPIWEVDPRDLQREALAARLEEQAPAVLVVQNTAIAKIMQEICPRGEAHIIALRRDEHSAFSGFEMPYASLARNAVLRLDSMCRQEVRGTTASPEVTVVPEVWVECQPP